MTIARCSQTTVDRPRVIVANKSDLSPAWDAGALNGAAAIVLSATTGQGVDRLRAALVEAAAGEPLRDVPAITNLRHVDLLSGARAALDRAEAAARAATPEEFVLADLTKRDGGWKRSRARAARTTCCTRYSRGSVSGSELSFVEVAEEISSSVVRSQGCGAVDEIRRPRAFHRRARRARGVVGVFSQEPLRARKLRGERFSTA